MRSSSAPASVQSDDAALSSGGSTADDSSDGDQPSQAATDAVGWFNLSMADNDSSSDESAESDSGGGSSRTPPFSQEIKDLFLQWDADNPDSGSCPTKQEREELAQRATELGHGTVTENQVNTFFKNLYVWSRA